MDNKYYKYLYLTDQQWNSLCKDNDFYCLVKGQYANHSLLKDRELFYTTRAVVIDYPVEYIIEVIDMVYNSDYSNELIYTQLIAYENKFTHSAISTPFMWIILDLKRKAIYHNYKNNDLDTDIELLSAEMYLNFKKLLQGLG